MYPDEIEGAAADTAADAVSTGPARPDEDGLAEPEGPDTQPPPAH